MNNLEKVYQQIESQRSEIVEFVQSLVQAAPVNPAYSEQRDERECQEIINERLNKIDGMNIEQFDVSLEELEDYRGLPGYIPGFTDKQPFENRPNILSCLPGGNSKNAKSIILTGHSDVVAADNMREWIYPPFDGVVEDGTLHGRGSVDMLSGLGSMVMAIEAIVKSGVELAGDLWFASAVCEESGGTGFLSIANHIKNKNINIDAGIMGEPTDLDLSLLCRGIQWGEIIITGRTGHNEVTQPHWTEGGAVDAIQKARYLMDAIDELNRDWSTRPDKNHPLLTESCEVKIAKMEGGHHLSSYADYCKLSFNIQVLPHESDENGLGTKTRKEFEAFIESIAKTDPWLKENLPQIHWTLEADCSEVPADHPFVDTFKHSAKDVRSDMKVLGSGFHTDTGWLDRLADIPVVNFGPGDPKLAHVTNEHCKVEDIITATKLIAATCINWCKSNE